MKIACPHCGFSRDVPEEKIPDRPVKITCPKCAQGFSFDKTAEDLSTAFDATFGVPAADAAPLSCPACGLEQPPGENCAGCGVNYARWQARQEARGQAAPAPQPPLPHPAGAAVHAAADPADREKAGFWIRFAAYLIDATILGIVQFFVGLALGLAGATLTGDGDSVAMALIGGLCGMVIGMAYAIFFTGYNGQTPGKMLLRIQVVRTDGTPMNYGRAFLREVIGKFVSGIILGIGYLMAAFDRQKQGLHDRIAGTYVIKL